MRARASNGYSLPELLWVVALLVTVTAIAIPQLLAGLDEARGLAAARYVAGRLHEARMAAIARSAHVALRFDKTADGYEYAMYLDVNRNGVRTSEIQAGVDRPITSPERLWQQIPGTDFGLAAGVPAVEGGTVADTTPIKFGTSSMASFTALGNSSSGSAYVRSRKGAQYVVRVFGGTGKIRVLWFDPRTNKWIQR